MINKDQLLKKILTKQTKDYTYMIGFFLTFSFFLFFIIRPNILSVLESQEKIIQLTKTNDYFEKQIDQIIAIQGTFETHRDDLSLLNEAVSTNPQVNKILSDTNEAAVKSNLKINKVAIADLNLKDKAKGDKIKALTLNMEVNGNFEQMISLINEIHNQRRLKLVKVISIGKTGADASSSGSLKMAIDVEGYYL